MTVKHYSDRTDWDQAVKKHGLDREHLQFGIVEAFNRDGDRVAAWYGPHCVHNGERPYGVINLDKIK